MEKIQLHEMSKKKIVSKRHQENGQDWINAKHSHMTCNI